MFEYCIAGAVRGVRRPARLRRVRGAGGAPAAAARLQVPCRPAALPGLRAQGTIYIIRFFNYLIEITQTFFDTAE